MSGSNFYSDSKFGVIQRQWFGLSRKWGGYASNARAATIAGCFATHGGTSIKHVTKWYPRGPIKMVKAGSMVLATLLNSTHNGQITGRLRTRGASASVGTTWTLKGKGTSNTAAVGSNTVFTVAQVKAGEYISIMTATCVTAKATRVQATTTGTVAFFVDYVPTYDSTGKWDV